MKNLVLFSFLSLLSTNFAFAVVSSTGNLALSGSITDSVSLTVTPKAAASTLSLTTTTTDLSVATVNEVSNAQNGYQVLAKSTNAGKLVHSTDSASYVAYTIKYNGGSAVSLTTTDQQVKSATGGNYNVNTDVTISYTGGSSSSLKSGSYTDTITFTLQSL